MPTPNIRVLGCEVDDDQIIVAFSDGKTYVFPAAFLIDNRTGAGHFAASDTEWLKPDDRNT